MIAIMIGVDPRDDRIQAVAADAAESLLGELRERGTQPDLPVAPSRRVSWVRAEMAEVRS